MGEECSRSTSRCLSALWATRLLLSRLYSQRDAPSQLAIEGIHLLGRRDNVRRAEHEVLPEDFAPISVAITSLDDLANEPENVDRVERCKIPEGVDSITCGSSQIER